MSDKRKILFVDDEARILEGLRRMLRSMRNEWDMIFVDNGPAALEEMTKQDFDVIVSDMRMPGMDGSQLLNRVKNEHPEVARIALSGQTSKDTILRSVGPIHQYLPKPCDADALKATVNRVCELRAMLNSPKIRALTSQLESLPCLSNLYKDLTAELESPNASVKTIAQIIGQDPAMSAKILQLVNSAFFGIQRHVGSVEQAVTLLGLELVKALVLSVRIFSQFDASRTRYFSQSSLWKHSITTGTMAKKIAQSENAPAKMVDHALLGGLLHDIGQMVLATIVPVEYDAVLDRLATDAVTSTQVELEALGATHAEVGAYLLGLWGFADPIIDALVHHHHPSQSPDTGFTALTAVHVADTISNQIQSPRRQARPPAFDQNYLQALGLENKLDFWKELCQQQVMC